MKSTTQSPLHRVLCCIMPPTQQPNHTNTTFLTNTLDCGLQKLITSLDEVTQTRTSCKDLDLSFLKGVLESQDLQTLMKVHDKVSVTSPQQPRASAMGVEPVCENASDLRQQIAEELEFLSYAKESPELLRILIQPHVKALLSAHDLVAGHDFLPRLPELASEVDEDDGLCVKVVQLVKATDQPLGATIQMVEGDCQMVQVARVLHGGAADRSGLLCVGDEVKRVNGAGLDGLSHDQVLEALARETAGSVMLTLRPTAPDASNEAHTLATVRACFDYTPYSDPYTPCPEAGLAFQCGDVLHVVSRRDAWWWQARRHGAQPDDRAGLIPSPLLAQKMRDQTGTKENKENRNLSDEKSGKFSPKFSKKSKKCKKLTDFDYPHQTPTYYEEVAVYNPDLNFRRPLFLLAPQQLLLEKLCDHLVRKLPEMFVRPHLCSNLPLTQSKASRIKHFTTEELEKAIIERRVLESEEKGGYFYVLTTDEVKQYLQGSKTCIIHCKPEAVELLRRPDIKPYVVLVKPTPQDKNMLSGIPRKASKDSDARIMEQYRHLEAAYGHIVDSTLTYDKDLSVPTQALVQIVHNLERHPAWVPASWVT